MAARKIRAHVCKAGPKHPAQGFGKDSACPWRALTGSVGAHPVQATRLVGFCPGFRGFRYHHSTAHSRDRSDTTFILESTNNMNRECKHVRAASDESANCPRVLADGPMSVTRTPWNSNSISLWKYHDFAGFEYASQTGL